MTKKEEEWTVQNIVAISIMCCLSYVGGIVLLYNSLLMGIGFILTPTLVIIPTLIEARKKIRIYRKKRRREKLRKNQETVIVGGTPQEHHKKKKRQPETYDFHVIDDETSKGKMMEELGLFYEKPAKRFSFKGKEEEVITTQKHERINKLDMLFNELEAFGKIRFSYQAHVGNIRGADIGRFVKREAQRRGLSNVTVKQKGKDIIVQRK